MDFNKEMEETLTKIKELTDWTEEEILNKIGYSVTYISGRRKKGSNLKFNGILSNLYEIELSKKSNNTYTDRRRLDKLTRRNRVPLYDAQTQAGTNDVDMTPVQAPAGSIDVGDLLHDSEAAIRIYGNSMIPNYPPGCVVGLIKITNKYIEPGEVYVIETRDSRKLKRLFYKDDNPESDTLILYSDNTMKFDGGPRHGKFAYPMAEIQRSEIIQLYAVTGVIKRNANSIIVNREVG